MGGDLSLTEQWDDKPAGREIGEKAIKNQPIKVKILRTTMNTRCLARDKHVINACHNSPVSQPYPVYPF